MIEIRKHLRRFINFFKFFKIIFFNWIKKFNLRDIFKNFKPIYISSELGFTFLIKNKISNFDIDSTLVKSDLCMIGEKFGTDKSPYNKELHRQSYTSVYNLIFCSLRNKKINFAEIGILNNASIKMWREFFSQAIIYGFDFHEKFINKAKKDNLRDVNYIKINVKDSSSIINAFKKTNKKFDIIIDDSSHDFDDQINIIRECCFFLKPGGLLVIEDIPKKNKKFSEFMFDRKIVNEKKFFDFINFVDCNHLAKNSKGSNNSRILILARNNKKK